MFFLIFGSICHAQQKADTTQINAHLTKLTKTAEYRHFMNVNQLNETASYIFTEFSKYSDSVDYQLFNVNKNEYKNVICSFGTEHTQRVIIGAHYDVCGNQEGADDNASGVVGLLELARLLKNSKLPYRVDLVAYSLEEPPFFRTKSMGSYIHAHYLKNNKIPVIGMISVEMIGYFSKEKNSQDYPISLLKLKYGSRGDFI
ncbi:MAG: M28 family peptidase, partial [Crocinitomicaceae bacterium]